MFDMTPQLSDSLLINRAKSKGMINDPSQLIASNAAQQAGDRLAVQSAGNALTLGNQRLAEDERRFGVRSGLARERFDFGKAQAGYNNKQRNLANALAGTSFGVSLLDDFAANKRYQQQMKIKKDMIERLGKLGDNNSKFFAEFLTYLNI